MPEIDAYHVAIPLLVLMITVASYESQKSKIRSEFRGEIFLLKQQNQELEKDIGIASDEVREMTATCEKMSKQIKERGNSIELKEFLKDIEVKGYGIVRIDPDDVFYRGRN